MRTYSVWQVNNYVKRMMDEDVYLSDLYIEGEISNFKEHSSGHLYFTLKDTRAAISAVMWRSHAERLDFSPQNGAKVTAKGRISAYEKTGAYQFYAELMQPVGLGTLYLAFTALKNKLEAEGLFDPSRKRSLPASPKCIGIVTSADGAALRDIITVCGRRNPRVKLLLAPAAVQGAGSELEIAAAIGNLNAHGGADIIIVGRGGGSIEDLWAFNEEAAARAVAASRIPVVSAVGHETDFTICDFAADLRAPTPSAAAELCVPELAETAETVNFLTERLQDAIFGKLDGISEYMEVLLRKVTQSNAKKLQMLENRTETLIRSLNALAPLNILKRGYGLLYINGEIARSAAEAEVGSEMSVKLSDGTVHGKITGVENDYAKD